MLISLVLLKKLNGVMRETLILSVGTAKPNEQVEKKHDAMCLSRASMRVKRTKSKAEQVTQYIDQF